MIVKAAEGFLYEFGGDIPDWLQPAADRLIRALAKAEGRPTDGR